MKDKAALSKYLSSQKLMSVSSGGGKTLWSASVYFAFDKNFDCYFVSSPDSEHCQNLKKDKHVACAIADSRQPNSSKNKIGVQMRGVAVQLRNEKEIKAALALWHKASPGMEKVVNFKNMQNKKIHSRIFKIKPDKIKFFGYGTGEEKQKVFNFR